MSKNVINQAVNVLKQGGVILIPTETVYGIAVDATNKSAVDKIYQIKKRDIAKPLQILVKNLEMAKDFVKFNQISENAAKKYWAGPLTLILDEIENSKISENIKSTNKTLGVRVAKHEITSLIFQNIDFPLAATSANISGEASSVDFTQAKNSLGGKVDFMIDGGKVELGKASTVADLRDINHPKIIREGILTLKDLL
jgi:L-threonylcarbamoyladenylate synthase